MRRWSPEKVKQVLSRVCERAVAALALELGFVFSVKLRQVPASKAVLIQPHHTVHLQAAGAAFRYLAQAPMQQSIHPDGFKSDMCWRKLRSHWPSSSAASAWLNPPSFHPSQASKFLILQFSCMWRARLLVRVLHPFSTNRTDRLLKTRQLISCQHGTQTACAHGLGRLEYGFTTNWAGFYRPFFLGVCFCTLNSDLIFQGNLYN